MGWVELVAIAFYLALSGYIVMRNWRRGRGNTAVNLVGAGGMVLLVYIAIKTVTLYAISG